MTAQGVVQTRVLTAQAVVQTRVVTSQGVVQTRVVKRNSSTLGELQKEEGKLARIYKNTDYLVEN